MEYGWYKRGLRNDYVACVNLSKTRSRDFFVCTVRKMLSKLDYLFIILELSFCCDSFFSILSSQLLSSSQRLLNIACIVVTVFNIIVANWWCFAILCTCQLLLIPLNRSCNQCTMQNCTIQCKRSFSTLKQHRFLSVFRWKN